MKRKSNKFISLLLALTMLLNMLPLGVWADEGDITTPPEEEQQIEQLSDTDEGGSDTDTGNENKDTLDDISGGEGSGNNGEQEEQVYTDGSWEFKVNQNNHAIITGYTDTFTNGVVNIPDDLTATENNNQEYVVVFIGNDAFCDRDDIIIVNVPNTLKRINAGAFANCTNLQSINIPENFERIGQNAFEGCSNLTITYEGSPSQWKEIVGNTDIGTDKVTCQKDDSELVEGWNYKVDKDRVTITGYEGDITEVFDENDALIIPQTLEGKLVVYIDEEAFQNKAEITSVVIPVSVKEIRDNAFAGTTLISITYEGTRYRWDQVYKGDNAIPQNVNVSLMSDSVYNGWVYEFENENDIVITGHKGTFDNNVVEIPATIEDNEGGHIIRIIGNNVFDGEKDIIKVVLPDRIRRISNRAFRNCENLANINIPANVSKIGNQAFKGCKNLTAITLPTSIEEIGEMAFVECNASLVITYLGTEYQWNLIEKGNNAIGNATVNCIGQPGWTYVTEDDGAVFLTGYSGPLSGEVTLPSVLDGRKVEFVGGNTFNKQTEITKLIVPEGYVRINPDSFKGCTSLQEVYLPTTIRHIGLWCFSECPALTKVEYAGRDDMWEDEVEVLDHAFEPYDLDKILVFGDDGIYDLSGTVKTSDGTPISGATVTLTRENGTTETFTTDADGKYWFADLSYKFTYLLSASAEGYPTRKIDFKPDKDSVYDFVFYTTAEYAANIDLAHLREDEVVHFNPSIAEDKGDRLVLSNVLSGLVEMGVNGQVVPALAESYTHNDNYTQWIFKVRDGLKWVDVKGVEKADLTAADFATALEWMLNSAKNPEGHSSVIMHEMLAGAMGYSEFTNDISASDAWSLTADSDEFTSRVGIAVDETENTITFNLTKPVSYFPTVLTGSNFLSFFPLSQAMIGELGLGNVNSMDNADMWYCGPYLLKEFVEGNYKVYEPNPSYWDTDSTLFERVVITMVGSYEDAFELFEAGQLDYVEIDGPIADSLIRNGSEYSDNLVSKVLRPYAYQMHWNFNKFDADKPILDENGNHAHDYYEKPLYEPDTNWNKAIANEDFRLSLYYGWELSNYYARTNPIDPLKVEHNTNTMVDVTYTSDGKDYTELVKERLGIGSYTGESMVRLKQKIAQQHKEAAMAALLAQGVAFPIEIDYFVQDNEIALENIAVLRNCLYSLVDEDGKPILGEDYVTINVYTYDESMSKEVRDPQLQSLTINGWGMDYSDPYNNLSQFGVDEDSYYSEHWNNILDLLEDTPSYAEEVVSYFETYASMLAATEALTDDARLEALAAAEAYLISHGLVTPCYINVGYCIGYIAPDSMVSSIMKDWVVYDELVGGGNIHDNGITDMGVWKHAGNCFDWILKDNGTLYFTGNGEDGDKVTGNSPWERYKNGDIKKIIISAGVTGLKGTNAFNGVKATEIIFLKYTITVDTAGTYTLRSTPSTITYSKLETIGEGVFANCTALTSIDIPEGVMVLGISAFENCTAMESMVLPSTITEIGTDAFADTGLTKIIYDGTTDDFAEIDGCDDVLFDTYQNLEGAHDFADVNNDAGINIADVDLLYRMAQ